jgi:HNH endonuclease
MTDKVVKSSSQLSLFGETEVSELVVRTSVPNLTNYKDYRKFLRRDFFYSCAYCGMSEAEASAIRFTIDHYEPQSARPELEKHYENLMWCCDECNIRKGSRCPSNEARLAGHRFFRPDLDKHSEHFARLGLRLNSKSSTGEYTIDAIDLNRQSLRRLRELRQRLYDCDEAVTRGMQAFRGIGIDRLPPQIKGPVLAALKNAERTREAIVDAIDKVLIENSKSPYLEDDRQGDLETKARRSSLKSIDALYPNTDWRK